MIIPSTSPHEKLNLYVAFNIFLGIWTISPGAKLNNSASMVTIIQETIVKLSYVTLVILRYYSCVLLEDT